MSKDALTPPSKDIPLVYSPVSGMRPMGFPHPCMNSAEVYRKHFPGFIWMFNPYSGTRRYTADIDSDPYGLLIVPKPQTGE